MQITYIYWDQSQCHILRNYVGARGGVLTIDDGFGHDSAVVNVDQYLTVIL